MARPTMPLGTYGKITTWETSAGFTARTKYRDLDGVVRPEPRKSSSPV
jgi:hypothetical protein